MNKTTRTTAALAAIAAALLLCGCANPLRPAAGYTYSHTTQAGDTCSVTVTSDRELTGVKIAIGSDCKLSGGADNSSNPRLTVAEAQSLITSGIQAAAALVVP